MLKEMLSASEIKEGGKKSGQNVTAELNFPYAELGGEQEGNRYDSEARGTTCRLRNVLTYKIRENENSPKPIMLTMMLPPCSGLRSAHSLN